MYLPAGKDQKIFSVHSNRRLTATSKAGNVASTAPRNTRVITMFGLFGSGRKMWWISGNFPYRSGCSAAGIGTFGSSSIARGKASLLYPSDAPKEAMTMLAVKGDDERSN